MLKYFKINYLLNQYYIVNNHYDLVLKKITPPKIYNIYVTINKKISLYLLPFFLFIFLILYFYF